MSEACYHARIEEGVYNSVENQLRNMGSAAFAMAEYGQGKDFSREFSRATDPRGQWRFVDNTTKSEYNTVIFGEVCPSRLGTINCAKGSHYLGPESVASFLFVCQGMVLTSHEAYQGWHHRKGHAGSLTAYSRTPETGSAF